MNDEKVEKKSKFKWLEKLKKIKHIEIIIVAIFAVIMVLIYMSSLDKGITTKDKTNPTSSSSISQYIKEFENDLEDILGKIKGVGNVSVMISLDMSSASLDENKNIEISSFPPIKGVIVVAKGVENVQVKMNVLKAVQSVIDITNGNIEIISSD